MWPNRCSSAIDEANSRLQELCETADHLHFLDLGQVSSHTAFFLPVALLSLAARSSTHPCKWDPSQCLWSAVATSASTSAIHAAPPCTLAAHASGLCTRIWLPDSLMRLGKPALM